MVFSSSKLGHIAQILTTGSCVEFGTAAFTSPTADEVEILIRILVQVVVGIVTIVATIRKMLQKPQEVVQAPLTAVLLVPPAPVPAAGEPAPPSLADAAPGRALSSSGTRCPAGRR